MDMLAEAGEGIDYFFKQPEYKKEMLIWKDSDLTKTTEHLKKISEILCDIKEGFLAGIIKNAILPYAEKNGKGSVLWPFRVALTGLEKSPDPFIIAEILGKEETIKRLKYAIEKI